MTGSDVRRFTGNPFKRVLAERGIYMWAVRTVVRSYMEAGLPSRLPTCSDPFAEWSDLVRSGLVWLGYVSSVGNIEAVMDGEIDGFVIGLYLSSSLSSH